MTRFLLSLGNRKETKLLWPHRCRPLTRWGPASQDTSRHRCFCSSPEPTLTEPLLHCGTREKTQRGKMPFNHGGKLRLESGIWFPWFPCWVYWTSAEAIVPQKFKLVVFMGLFTMFLNKMHWLSLRPLLLLLCCSIIIIKSQYMFVLDNRINCHGSPCKITTVNFPGLFLGIHML